MGGSQLPLNVLANASLLVYGAASQSNIQREVRMDVRQIEDVFLAFERVLEVFRDRGDILRGLRVGILGWSRLHLLIEGMLDISPTLYCTREMTYNRCQPH